MFANKSPIIIVGVGNVLCSDEGVGIHVIDRLKKMDMPPYVSVFDCGTNGMAVLEALDGAEKGIIIDAASMGGAPGSIYRFTIDEILSMKSNLFRLVSLHQFDLISTLKVAQITHVYKIPDDVIVIGIEGKNYDFSLKLSSEVENSISTVIDMIMEDVRLFKSK